MKSSEADNEKRWPIRDRVIAVAALGLRSEQDTAPFGFNGFDWPHFLSACEDQRLLGLLAEAVRTDCVRLTDEQHESLERRLREWLVHDLAVEARVLGALGELRANAIDVRVLKGVALANSVYGEPSLRVFGDADLLVQPGSFAAAASCLEKALGATRELPELRPGFDERFGREILLRSGPVEIDLHRLLVDGPYGFAIPSGDLFDNPTVFHLGGSEVHGLGPAQRFLHACLSAVLGDWPPRLIVLRDVAEMLSGGRDRMAADADAVLAMAKRWRAEAVVALAVRRAVEDLGLEIAHPLVDWAMAYRPTLRDRVLLAAYRGRARGYTSQALSVLAISGWRNRWDYLRAILRPSRAYLEARGFRRGDRLLRAMGRRGRRRK